MNTAAFRAIAVVGIACWAGTARAEVTEASIAAPVGAQVLAVHAEGAQLYECKPSTGGALAWRLREPIAALMHDGQTIGRHFVGPSWELADGSLVVGKVVEQAAGATQKDIPWLKLSVSERRGKGLLDSVTGVQRINTSGGSLVGDCPRVGVVRAEPYAADYVFFRE